MLAFNSLKLGLSYLFWLELFFAKYAFWHTELHFLPFHRLSHMARDI